MIEEVHSPLQVYSNSDSDEYGNLLDKDVNQFPELESDSETDGRSSYKLVAPKKELITNKYVSD